jgi:hypothetical protein
VEEGAEDGRGVLIVDAITDRRGCDPLPHRPGSAA